MANSSNFLETAKAARSKALVGPNVISNALPYLGGGLVLTAVGVYGGLGVLQSYPSIFFPTFFAAMVVELILFFVARGVAEKGNNSVALPLLTTYSLLSGYTLSGLIAYALGTSGVGFRGIAIAALGCGVAFIAGRRIGSNLSEEDGFALGKTISIALIALLVVLVGQLGFALFGVGTPTFLEVGISAAGVFIFAGASVLDFFILPRAYRDEQYLSAALSMYLTYINLFIFLLRLIIALNGRD